MSYTWNYEFLKAKVSHKNEWEQGVEYSVVRSLSLPASSGNRCRRTAVCRVMIEKNIHR